MSSEKYRECCTNTQCEFKDCPKHPVLVIFTPQAPSERTSKLKCSPPESFLEICRDKRKDVVKEMLG